MADPTPLSPTAQAVLDAVCASTEPDCDTQHLIAAALRAAADQVVPPTNEMSPEARTAREIRFNLLAIAAELENN